jgi:1-acyl-sn-glycerol-3-phosphate acyltransferase
MIGTDEIQATDAKLPRFFRKVTIRFGSPIPLGHYVGRQDDRIVLRQITDEVMFEIGSLSGQTYVDEYATRRRGGEGGVGGDGRDGAGGDGAEGRASRADGDTEGPVARSSAEVLRSSP